MLKMLTLIGFALMTAGVICLAVDWPHSQRREAAERREGR